MHEFRLSFGFSKAQLDDIDGHRAIVDDVTKELRKTRGVESIEPIVDSCDIHIQLANETVYGKILRVLDDLQVVAVVEQL